MCALLETCGHYFNRGSSGHRLDAFLTRFQRYLLSKPPLPSSIEFDVLVSAGSRVVKVWKFTRVLVFCRQRSDQCN